MSKTINKNRRPFPSNLRLATAIATIALAVPSLAAAQDNAEDAVAASGEAGKLVYTPADFARFSPKTAYDMLSQVPSFTIHSSDQERGLGQASENVLIDGQRVANKTGGAVDVLQKTPAANVVRIEIVDASTLGIAGLSGQVANVVLTEEKSASGQFAWRPDVRAHYAKPNFFKGNISYSGKSGWLDYTLSIKNPGGRGAFAGPIVLTDASGNVIETRHQLFHSESELVTFETKFGIDGPGTSEGNLTLGYTPYWAPSYSREDRMPVGGVNYTRLNDQKLDGFYYDVNGDYAFDLGGGRLKLIGLRHFDHEPFDVSQINSYADGRPDDGVRFLRNSRIGETVLRAEYGWKGGKNDWQLSFERAYNSLDQRGTLYTLGADGEFTEVPYPDGSGHVVETRYEGIATWNRPIGDKADIQVAAGAEVSKLARLDGDLEPRDFFRPKGSVVLGWRPGDDWDLSLRLRRRVGQISFYDFLAQPNLQQERENSGNPDLVPPQSWEVETEFGKSLGAWGKTRLRLYHHWIEDIVDIIPVGVDGEAVGNLPHARRWGMEWTNTFQLEPVGVKGAKIDLSLELQDSSVADPLSGMHRPISNELKRYVNASYRHDIPSSDWAYGFGAEHYRMQKGYYLTEISEGWEGPLFDYWFIENKDVFGLTVNFTVVNLTNARHRRERTVYDGRRLSDPVLFNQLHDQLIGPIFRLTVKGTF
ncbi:TonB-dependent receptor [Altererythrobacter salegens]|uniref:TonB-dependent receptor n=1 Tax=Croceibacterium salegens TaxID=1737568 RepID=A0A6I4SWX9_9SPHN|nr:TonB-dependent receptor [Croceibacterium salegens]MXO59336.1 TonB-dependent receptor [Croceibacterium salegens]